MCCLNLLRLYFIFFFSPYLLISRTNHTYVVGRQVNLWAKFNLICIRTYCSHFSTQEHEYDMRIANLYYYMMIKIIIFETK